MKLAKKLLVAILALALLASCLVLAVSADGAVDPADRFRVEQFDDPTDILEYYVDDIYLSQGYDDQTVNEDYYTATRDQNYHAAVEEFVADASDDGYVYSVELPYQRNNKYELGSNKGEVFTEKVFITLEICFDETSAYDLTYDIKVGVEGNSSRFSILKFDFSAMRSTGVPVISYVDWDNGISAFGSTVVTVPAYDAETGEGFTPATGVWYEVVICYNGEEDSSYFEITGDDGSYYKLTRELAGAKGVWGFAVQATFEATSNGYYSYNCTASSCKKHNANLANAANLTEDDEEYACINGTCRVAASAKYSIDNLEIYEGSFLRDTTDAEAIKALTITTLEDLEDYYLADDVTREEKLEIAEVLNTLYSLPEETFSSDLRAILPDVNTYIYETYLNELSIRVSEIDAEANYYDRVAHLENSVKYFYDIIPTGDALAALESAVPGITESAATLKAAYDAELTALETIKSESEAFIALMGGYDVASRDYEYIKALYLDGAGESYVNRSEDYLGVLEANEIFAGLTVKYDRMISDVDAFVAGVDGMVASTTFGELYAAYYEAYKSYVKYGNDGVINPDIDVDTNDKLLECYEHYENEAPDIVAVAAECDAFNTLLVQAKASTYYPALCDLLEQAEAALVPVYGSEDDFAYKKDYNNLEANYALYLALVQATEDTEDASEAYINSVNAIAQAQGFYAKRAAVDAALALKASGDNLAVDGVLEANLALTAAEAEINILEGNSTTFLLYVEKLEDADTLSERKELILLAAAIVDAIAEDYDGVASAIATLESETAEFTAEVNAINAALANATANVIALK